MKAKRISFLLFSFAAGGEERIASILARYLNKEFDLHIVLFNRPIDFEIPRNVQLKILRSNYQRRIFRLITLPVVVWRYYIYIKRENIAISISFDTVPNYVNCLLKMGGWRGKILLREVTHASSRYPKNTWYGRIHRLLIKHLYHRADKIFVNAKRIADNLLKDFDIITPMELMHNPFDFQFLQQQKKAPIQPPDKYTFIHVANFRPQKNHDLLIDAFAKISHFDVQLWLLGKGALKNSIREKVENKGLGNQIHFFGFRPNVFQYMIAANCMVLSSDFEGLPNVLIEGLACGLPVVSTDCPSGPREVLAPNTDLKNHITKKIELAEYGILTPINNVKLLANAMEIIMNDENLANKYRKKAPTRARDFDVEKIANHYIAAF